MAEKKILIVDDQYGIRTLLTEVMQRDGFHVLDASDGSTALDLYRQHRPTVILVDIRIPNMDGIQVIEAIRNEDQHVHSLAMTAFDLTEQETDKLRQLGVSTIYRKPFDLDNLREDITGRFQEMTTHVYNKLVRDRIPQIIEEKGKTCCIKILDDAAYHRELRKKLQEE
ncbi:UNVERIFIED_CONTAM: CheY-like chemotaxis protein [Brevibacillus sp. OAP136]